MSATDIELEASSESCERWGWFCGAFVVAGVAAEVIIAAINPQYGSFWERWGTVFADALVVLGVLGEIMFSRIGFSRQKELTRRSESRVAQLELDAGVAEERAATLEKEAAEARRETAKLRADFGWRKLSERQHARLVHELSQSQGPALVIYSSGDVESEAYAMQFIRVFEAAGWSPALRSVQFSRLEFGLMVPESNDPLGQPSKILRTALNAVGIQFDAGMIPYSGSAQTRPFGLVRAQYAEIPAELYVGPKPYSYA